MIQAKPKTRVLTIQPQAYSISAGNWLEQITDRNIMIGLDLHVRLVLYLIEGHKSTAAKEYENGTPSVTVYWQLSFVHLTLYNHVLCLLLYLYLSHLIFSSSRNRVVAYSLRPLSFYQTRYTTHYHGQKLSFLSASQLRSYL